MCVCPRACECLGWRWEEWARPRCPLLGRGWASVGVPPCPRRDGTPVPGPLAEVPPPKKINTNTSPRPLGPSAAAGRLPAVAGLGGGQAEGHACLAGGRCRGLRLHALRGGKGCLGRPQGVCVWGGGGLLFFEGGPADLLATLAPLLPLIKPPRPPPTPPHPHTPPPHTPPTHGRGAPSGRPPCASACWRWRGRPPRW